MTIRVLHLITKLELGGAQRNTLYTVAHLNPSDFEAGLAWGPGGMLDEEAEKLDAVARFPIPSLDRPPSLSRDPQSLREIRRVIREFRPDILHTHSSKAGVVGRGAGHLEKVPLIVHSVHGWGFTPTQSPIHRALFFLAERIASRWTSHWIVVSEANRHEGERLGLLDPDRVSLIRSGIKLGPFRKSRDRSRIRRDLGISPDAFVCLQVGNFKAQKAPLDFVALADRLCREDPSIHCLMAGDGPLRYKVEEEILRRDLVSRVHLLGWMDDIPSLWAAADLGIMTSRHEGLPRAVVEALASAKPVVATAVDGTPEVVIPGVNGFLFEPGDVARATSHILRIRRDPALAQRLAQAAPKKLDAFDIDVMVGQQEELYRCLKSRQN